MTYLKRQFTCRNIAPANYSGSRNVGFRFMFRIIPYKNINIFVSFILVI